MTFLRESGAPVVKTYTVPGNYPLQHRRGRRWCRNCRTNRSARASTVTNGVPIAVERSMYWNVNGMFWPGGTNAVGSVVP